MGDTGEMTGAAASNAIIHVGSLVDGVNRQPRKGAAVCLADGRITRICDSSEFAGPSHAGTRVFDFSACTMLPGLIDCHVHTNMPGDGTSVFDLDREDDETHLAVALANARRAVETGVTTVRETGAWNNVAFALKHAIEQADAPGPRVDACGRPLTITGGHCWMMGSVTDGVDEVRGAVRRLVHDGADFIKVMGSGGTEGSNPVRASYAVGELQAIVDEAHRHGRLVGVHALSTDSIVNCLDARVDMIIHCMFFEPDGHLRFDPRIAERIAATGTWLNPTIYITQTHALMLREKRERDGLTEAEEVELTAAQIRADEFISVCRGLTKAGVKYSAGSDCGWGHFPFGSYELELKAMGDADLTTHEVIVSATSDAARSLGLQDEIGSIEVGKKADLLVIDGDPYADLTDLKRIVAVFKDGVLAHSGNGSCRR